jgi:hypothetical protein
MIVITVEDATTAHQSGASLPGAGRPERCGELFTVSP